MNPIVLNNIHLSYQNKPLFDGLNFALTPNKTTCLLGPSGVGKTTLLHLIAGLIKSHPSEQSKEISYLFQTDALLPWLSILDNVLIGYTLRGQRTKILEKKAIALLEKVGLGDNLHKKTYELSGGMRQRVAIARTFIEDRPIILMDEPFANLDALTRYEMQNLAANLFKDKTVLLVTHDPMEALRLGHEIRLMSDSPVTISEAIAPRSDIPRAMDDVECVALHAVLLKKITGIDA